ncbi:hypothetical protein [Undibacterium sp.]|jgi:hypothetical protein|uniref:hypothetical protein n=1 Tax=Undibacterium sp. TaxID=1914977 RepID=UPI002C6F769E|nr:hypothetical protein [Undibacterium sp.]HTD03638.1 hypothetical protein [Undibacterium sp.]
MSLDRRTASRIITLALVVTVAALFLLVLSYSSEYLLHRLFGLDSQEQVTFRDICSLVAIASLVLAAMVNQGARQNRK